MTFRFTAKGARRWSALTRAIARRGARSGRASANTGPGTFQHLAIVLDDRILTVPFVDYLGHPDGLDPRDGAQIEGGLTRASARALVALLKSGALPVQLGPDGP